MLKCLKLDRQPIAFVLSVGSFSFVSYSFVLSIDLFCFPLLCSVCLLVYVSYVQSYVAIMYIHVYISSIFMFSFI